MSQFYIVPTSSQHRPKHLQLDLKTYPSTINSVLNPRASIVLTEWFEPYLATNCKNFLAVYCISNIVWALWVSLNIHISPAFYNLCSSMFLLQIRQICTWASAGWDSLSTTHNALHIHFSFLTSVRIKTNDNYHLF